MPPEWHLQQVLFVLIPLAPFLTLYSPPSQMLPTTHSSLVKKIHVVQIMHLTLFCASFSWHFLHDTLSFDIMLSESRCHFLPVTLVAPQAVSWSPLWRSPSFKSESKLLVVRLKTSSPQGWPVPKYTLCNVLMPLCQVLRPLSATSWCHSAKFWGHSLLSLDAALPNLDAHSLPNGEMVAQATF